MKKLNKLVAILVAMAMVLALSVVSAFAVDNPTTGTNLYISKKLNIAQGLAAPENFNFTLTAQSVDGNTDATSLAAAPELTIPAAQLQGLTDTDNDGYIRKNTSITINPADFPHVGVYVYELAETDAGTSGVTYDGQKYTITIAKDADGNVRVVAQKADGTKVDADNPGTGDSNDDAESGVVFTNSYTKTADDTTTPSGTPASFYVVKDTTGKYGDTSKEFPFTITITYPSTMTAEQKTALKYFKYDNSADAPKATELAAAKVVENQDGTVTVSVDLADADEFYVTGAPIGTTYTVAETLGGDEASKKYTPSYSVTEGAVVSTTNVLAKDAENNEGQSKATSVVLVKDKASTAETNKNAVEWTNENTKDAGDEDPGTTGILVSNLPYIALALVAIGGLVAYVVVRRKADDEA